MTPPNLVNKVSFAPLRVFFDQEKSSSLLDYQIELKQLNKTIEFETETGKMMSVTGMLIYLQR